MKLKALTMENFQGIKNMTIEANGKNVSIYGTNGTGKTTVLNAVSWLLFNKASHDVKNYTPKTQDENGDDIHYLHHTAEGTFTLDDGTDITLKKDFYENWKKKRGSHTEEFSGHVIDYYIDGVPVKQKEYDSRVLSFCPQDKIKVLTMPRYFSETLSWQERREILLEVCGDVSDEQVILSNMELANLTGFLRKPGAGDQLYSVDEFLAIASNKKYEINKKMQEIPTRIDEAKNNMPDVDGISADEESDAIKKLESARMSLENDIANVNINISTSNLQAVKSNLMAEYAEKKAAYIEHLNEDNREHDELITELSKMSVDQTVAINTMLMNITKNEGSLSAMQSMRENLMETRKKVMAEKWEGDTVCRTCGQPLQADKVEAAKEEFNLGRSVRLENINRQGREHCNKDTIAKMKAEIDELKAELVKKQSENNDLLNRISYERGMSIVMEPFEAQEEAIDILNKMAEIDRAIKEGASIVSDEKSELVRRLSDLKIEIEQHEKNKLLVMSAKSHLERIAELEEEEKKLAGEYEKVQYGIYLCEVFTKTKVDLLNESINKKFKYARFRLFDEQINGGIKQTCTVLCNTNDGLKLYDDANTASQINAGIEIITTLAEHWGINLPILFDNAEGVVQLYETPLQVIRTMVNGKDKTLRVEVESGLKAVTA